MKVEHHYFSGHQRLRPYRGRRQSLGNENFLLEIDHDHELSLDDPEHGHRGLNGPREEDAALTLGDCPDVLKTHYY